MIAWLVLIGISAVIAVMFGYQRRHVLRQTSIEGIDSPEAAQAYDRISKWPQFKLLRRTVITELKKYHPEGSLIDIGCGPGYLVALMAKSFPALRIIGIDISKEMVVTASDNLSPLGLGSRLEFQQGDAQNLPLGDSSVDFALSTLSLHHWSDPKSALQEIHRVLKPSGQFLVFDLRRDSRRWFYWLIYFAQTFVVPAPMRRINEPLNSLLSSYTVAEVKTILSGTQFQKTNVSSRLAFMFIWGQK